MVKASSNHNSLKDYSLQQINNEDNRRLSLNYTESVKQWKKEKGLGGSNLTYLSDEVQHLVLTAASQMELKCETLPDVWTVIYLCNW